MKFVMLILFSANVVTALRIFSSVSRWPSAFQVPLKLAGSKFINERTHNKSIHRTNSPPKASLFRLLPLTPGVLGLARRL